MAVPKGPEDLPLKEYVNNHILIILVHDLNKNPDNENTIFRKEKINYSEPAERRWLGKITYWASVNGYSVETMSEKDWIDKVK